MKNKIPPEELSALVRALAQLNSEPNRPHTKIACEEEVARRLGMPWTTVTNRIKVLRLRVVPGPRLKAAKPRAWGENWKEPSARQ